MRFGSVARDSFAGQALIEREATVGDALDTLTLREVCDAVREQIGPRAELLEHTCDVIVTEVCRCWPERTMADIAAKLGCPKAADQVLDAIAVTTAKVRENIEARWGCKPSHKAALDLVLRACVVEFANLWFSCPEARIGMRAVIAVVRHSKRSA
jgi:hypothetical protein